MASPAEIFKRLGAKIDREVADWKEKRKLKQEERDLAEARRRRLEPAKAKLSERLKNRFTSKSREPGPYEPILGDRRPVRGILKNVRPPAPRTGQAASSSPSPSPLEQIPEASQDDGGRRDDDGEELATPMETDRPLSTARQGNPSRRPACQAGPSQPRDERRGGPSSSGSLAHPRRASTVAGCSHSSRAESKKPLRPVDPTIRMLRASSPGPLGPDGRPQAAFTISATSTLPEDEVDTQVPCSLCGCVIGQMRPSDSKVEIPAFLPCGHLFGHDCIFGWISHPNSTTRCPQNCISLRHLCEHMTTPTERRPRETVWNPEAAVLPFNCEFCCTGRGQQLQEDLFDASRRLEKAEGMSRSLKRSLLGMPPRNFLTRWLEGKEREAETQLEDAQKVWWVMKWMKFGQQGPMAELEEAHRRRPRKGLRWLFRKRSKRTGNELATGDS